MVFRVYRRDLPPGISDRHSAFSIYVFENLGKGKLVIIVGISGGCTGGRLFRFYFYIESPVTQRDSFVLLIRQLRYRKTTDSKILEGNQNVANA
jgi:hypothetical protein